MKKVFLEKSTAEIIVKKSRFIADIFPCFSEEEVKNNLELIRKKYYDARHVCFASVLGMNFDTVKFSDDGEPQGTAGKPILELFQAKEITYFLCTVTRYFGGILLGAGGLMHAYKDATSEAINNNILYDIFQGVVLEFEVEYSDIGQIKKYEENNASSIYKKEELYLDKIKLAYYVNINFLEKFKQDLTNFTKGKVNINIIDKVNYTIKDKKIWIIP